MSPNRAVHPVHPTRTISTTLAVLLAVLMATPVDAGEMPDPPEAAPWADVARRDLEFIHDELAENHPGAIDPQNEAFGVWLGSGYRQALDKAAAAETLDDVLATLRFYVAGFADGHTYLDLDYAPRWMRWPGFVAARDDGRVVVHHAEGEWPAELPPEGAEILACDGLSVEAIVTEGACGSACLDFADELLLMPGVIHAGAPTGADTVYMELRDVPLPSRLGRVSCAMKLYRNRSRGHNEPYVPEFRFEGDMSDTEAVRRWVRTLPKG